MEDTDKRAFIAADEVWKTAKRSVCTGWLPLVTIVTPDGGAVSVAVAGDGPASEVLPLVFKDLQQALGPALAMIVTVDSWCTDEKGNRREAIAQVVTTASGKHMRLVSYERKGRRVRFSDEEAWSGAVHGPVVPTLSWLEQGASQIN